ncbi:MAG: hypothetical protein H0T62_02770 [Parachlamydiaceae bacterium]|nr:hypothetical protein [Parachlamydiaceae bacterium]
MNFNKVKDLPLEIPEYVNERFSFNYCVSQLGNKELKLRIHKNFIIYAESRGFYSFEQIQKKNDNFEKTLDNPLDIIENKVKTIFKMTVAHLYRKVDLGEMKVAIGGNVSSDGLGDYFQMLFISSLLKEKVPSLVTMVHTNLGQRGINLTKPDECGIDLICINEEDYEQKKVESHLKSADFVLSIPHGKLPSHSSQKHLFIDEYGMEGASRKLGLGLIHGTDMGIAIKQPLRNSNLANIAHTSLREHLLEINNPFFVSYLKDKNRYGFIGEAHRVAFIIMALASCPEGISKVDIITTFSKLERKLFDPDVLNELNVGKIQLFKMDKENNKLILHEELILNEKEGKIVRIFDPFPLINADLMLLMKESNSLIGCTGDLSFSEVISHDKLPLYQTMGHKESFFKDITYITGVLHPEKFPHLHQFFENTHSLFSLPKKDLEKIDVFSRKSLEIGRDCQNPLLIDESKLFCAKIQKQYSSNEILVDYLMRKLSHLKHPNLKSAEKEILTKLLNGNDETLINACKNLKEIIEPYNQII